MADQVIRDELLDSDRWLDLPSDTDRLVFVGFILIADDFGNFEGGARRLYRFMQGFTQVKSAENAATVMLHLSDADMVRRYTFPHGEANGRELYHLPRFRPHRQYLVRKVPGSPWDEARELGKERRVFEKGLAKYQALAKNLVTTSQQRSNDVSEGVGVGVGVGVGENNNDTLATAIAVKPATVVPPSEPRAPPPASLTVESPLKARPTSSPEAGTNVSKGKRETRGSRMTADFAFPDDWREWAVQAYGITPQRAMKAFIEFRDYWADIPGQKGLKLTWFATFRNRLRAMSEQGRL